jgi:hypothetical protein
MAVGSAIDSDQLRPRQSAMFVFGNRLRSARTTALSDKID